MNLSDKALETTIKRIKKAALADLPSISQEFTVAELVDITQRLDHEIQILARATFYLKARGGYGCDLGHETAVKDQNQRVAKVRAALGFTVPREDVNF